MKMSMKKGDQEKTKKVTLGTQLKLKKRAYWGIIERKSREK